MSEVRAYRCMLRAELRAAEHAIRAVQDDDIERIRRWRNAQMDVLRQQAAIDAEAQRRYYDQHIWPDLVLAEPRNLLLSLFADGVHIGYGGLVHMSWRNRRAEVSFLLDPVLASDLALNARHFAAYLGLIRRLAFDDLGLHRLHTETFSFREQHIEVLEQAGFRREGVLRDHVQEHGRWWDSIMHGLIDGDER